MHEADSICTVVSASPFQCRWVTDMVTESGLRIFCGQPCPGTARPWCADHYPLIYTRRPLPEGTEDVTQKRSTRKADRPSVNLWKGKHNASFD